MNYAAFLSYIVLTAFTPGPNNIMAMSNASKHGFKGGFRFNLGVLFGFLIVMSICAAFTSLLYEFVPQIEPFMLVIGAAYILWLAWTVWRDKPNTEKKSVMSVNSVVAGMLLQFINVKVILYGVTGISTFLLPHFKGFWSLFPFVLLMSFVGFSGTCCWALFGTLFEVFFNKRKKLLNLILALWLIYCALSQLRGLCMHWQSY